MRITSSEPALSGDITAVIFGVDGVLIDTARASAMAWKAVLDPFLRSHATVHERNCRSFDDVTDYRRHLLGRNRLDGLSRYLAACDIDLTYDDLRGLAACQEETCLAEIRRHGVRPFPSSVATIRALHRRDIRTAAVSLYRCAAELLRRAGVADLMDLRMDGLDAPGTCYPGRPGPDLYREAALRLRTTPAHVAVVDENLDALAAARRGGFRLVIGVDRIGRSSTLREHGADLVVTDLSELPLTEGAEPAAAAGRLPSRAAAPGLSGSGVVRGR